MQSVQKDIRGSENGHIIETISCVTELQCNHSIHLYISHLLKQTHKTYHSSDIDDQVEDIDHQVGSSD